MTRILLNIYIMLRNSIRWRGLLHYKPNNTNLRQYPLVVSSISCALRERKDERRLEGDCLLTVTNA